MIYKFSSDKTLPSPYCGEENRDYLRREYEIDLRTPGNPSNSNSPRTINDVVGPHDFEEPSESLALAIQIFADTANISDASAALEISDMLLQDPRAIKIYPVTNNMGYQDFGISTHKIGTLPLEMELPYTVALALQDTILYPTFRLEDLQDISAATEAGNFLAYCILRNIHPTTLAPKNPVNREFALINGIVPDFEMNGKAKMFHTIYTGAYEEWWNSLKYSEWPLEVKNYIALLGSLSHNGFSNTEEEMVECFLYKQPILVLPSIFSVIQGSRMANKVTHKDALMLEKAYPLAVAHPIYSGSKMVLMIKDKAKSETNLHVFNSKEIQTCRAGDLCNQCSIFNCPLNSEDTPYNIIFDDEPVL